MVVMDCFVALLLAMTVENSICAETPIQNLPYLQRHCEQSEAISKSPPWNQLPIIVNHYALISDQTSVVAPCTHRLSLRYHIQSCHLQ